MYIFIFFYCMNCTKISVSFRRGKFCRKFLVFKGITIFSLFKATVNKQFTALSSNCCPNTLGLMEWGKR